jgi:hypothetical protein
MRGIRAFRWACLAALIFLLAPSAAAVAATKAFVPPVEGQVVRKFDAPAHEFAAGHRGIDYSVPAGTSVRASAAGTVSFAGPVADDGLFVTVQHPGAIATTYSYLSRIDVSRGDRVAQGQVLGASGNGHDGGAAALHFGAKQNDRYIDPLILLGDFDDITDLIGLVPVPADGVAAAPAAFKALPSTDHLLAPVTGPLPATGDTGAGPAGVRPVIPIPGKAGPAPVEGGRSGEAPTAQAKPPPKVDSPPAPSQGAWWRSIPDEFKQTLLEQDPNLINTPLVSAADRDAFNRKRLDQRIEELKAEKAAMGPMAELQHNAGIVAKGLISPWMVLSKYDREAAIDRKIRSAEHLRKQLTAITKDPRNRLRESDVYLMDFDIDFANGDGKAVVALGDPGTAEHIGVLVPGINNAVGSIEGSLEDAANLKSAVNQLGPKLDQRVSTIVWMGYDNPNGLPDAMNSGEAEEGAPWLKKFVSDLRDGHAESPQTPHITVFGHSYGSTVAGIAAYDGMEADDVAFLGSPGVGRLVDAEDFPQKRIWAARTKDDIIAAIADLFLGADPFRKSFGARRIPVDPEQKGHSEYYQERSTGLANLARIMVRRMEN